MTHDEAMHDGEHVSRAAAIREVTRHGCVVADFLHDLGEREQYSTRAVLEWLGY